MIFDGPIYIHHKGTVRQRQIDRKFCGPYQWTPDDLDKWLQTYGRPSRGRGFYQSSSGLSCGDSTFSLRLELANDVLTESRLRHTEGYYCDLDCTGDTLQPIIARLPHGRGFLAGWTMGNDMIASINLDIYKTPEDAAKAAHGIAEYDARKNQEHEALEMAEELAEDSAYQD